MLQTLGTSKLKDGATMDVARIDTPDDEWAKRIAPFLSHKGLPWNWQNEQTLGMRTDPLDANYYVGLVNGRLVGTVCTFEYNGVGILGHVFTEPEHRRRGVCKSIMFHQMTDFRARNGRALFLGTVYDSAAYHIYSSFGFRSMTPGSGSMEYYTDSLEAYEDEYFAPADATVRITDWRDWAGFTGLMCQTMGSYLRSVFLRLYGRCSMEYGYLALRREARLR